MSYVIRLATVDDIPLCYEHSKRHKNESGADGDLVFDPSNSFGAPAYERYEVETQQKWSRAISEVGWERTWILEDNGRVLGHLTLRQSPNMAVTLHRALLMMGLERPYRRRGIGSELMTMAIEWARAQDSLAWLQLYVFDHNKPAKALYKKFGFIETGTTPDMFRVNGESIDDTEMVLKLR